MSESTVAFSGERADPLAAMKMSVLFIVPFVVFLVHTLEELPQFAAWVSDHFAPLTTEKFAVTHIPLILVVLLCSWQAA